MAKGSPPKPSIVARTITVRPEQGTPRRRKWWKLVYGRRRNTCKKRDITPPTSACEYPSLSSSIVRSRTTPQRADAAVQHAHHETSFRGSPSKSPLRDDCSLLRAISEYEEDEGEEQGLPVSWDENEKLQRLESNFQRRKQKLRLLSNGRSRAYVKMLLAGEEEAHQILVANCTIGSDKGKDNVRQRTETVPSSLFLQSFRSLLFELNHTLPASYLVLLVCMGHTTFYAFLDVFMTTSYYTMISSHLTPTLNLGMFHGFEVIIGLLLIRINGNIFYWQDPTSFHLANIEMRNRLKLNRWDALIVKRLKGTLLSSAMNMFGFYLAYMGLAHFYYGGLSSFVGIFSTWYDRIWKQAETGLWEAARANMTPAADGTNLDRIRFLPSCDMLVEQISPLSCSPRGDWLDVQSHYHPQYYKENIQQWLVRQFCMDESQEWRILSLLYHGFWLALASTLIAVNGDNILRYCDD
jgi:hypothetical protein